MAVFYTQPNSCRFQQVILKVDGQNVDAAETITRMTENLRQRIDTKCMPYALRNLNVIEYLRFCGNETVEL